MSSNHTPTPWTIDAGIDFSEEAPIGIYAESRKGALGDWAIVATCHHMPDDFKITRDEREANATHIVKCVNAHDELVEALRNIAAWDFDNGPHTQAQIKLYAAHVLSKVQS